MVISHAAVEDVEVVDLFAGSGALGIEALSRGAANVTFVERDRMALAVIRANLEATGLDGPAARLVSGDAVAHAARLGAADVVFVDPPYVFDGWTALGASMRAGGFAGVIVAESGAAIELGAGWEVVRVKRYGGTVVTVARAFPGGSLDDPE